MCLHHYQRLIGIVFIAWSLLVSSMAQAQVVPAYNGRMNVAVGGIVTAKVGKWGFAANDPRVAATGSAIGTGLTYIGIGLATGAVATVGWPALLIGAGISALVGGAMSLAMDGLYKWMFNADGTVSTQGGNIAAPDLNGYFLPSNAQQAAKCTQTKVYDWCAPRGPGTTTHEFYACMPPGAINPTYSCAPGASSNPPKSFEEAMTLAGYKIPTKTVGEDVTRGSATAAVNSIPSGELAKPISDEMLAAAANAAWKSAAANQGGLPWSASDPITPADVAQWRSANPTLAPTVGDMTAPISSGASVNVGAGATPGSAANPNTGPAPTAGSGTQVDLGPNPNAPAPVLEATPTAQQILSPILGLMPDIKGFQVPAHVGVCPKPSFVAFEKSYTFESHCGLIENSRSIIEAAMMLVWGIAAMFIVLKA